ncbi:MAG: hypothetical protein CM15mP124_3070 [Alphaproteobacteria bacterium]|nr:MAG: hypothetical protein CM15mP124_3070 [Alphaproteobacteria bacterium]
MPAMLAAMVTNCYEGKNFHTTLNSLLEIKKMGCFLIIKKCF